MHNLGKKLRYFRKNNNYTLRELGEKLNMSFSILAMYERNERIPPIDKLILFAKLYEISTDYLLGLSDNIYLANTEFSKNTIHETGTSYNNNLFKYKVKNNNMTESRIYPGDMVLIKKNKTINEGKIFLVNYNGNKNLYRIYINEDNYILHSDNPSYNQIMKNKNDILIIGEVVKVEFYL